uniref:Uncharacterized protein n=1 Tax=Cyclophora tenuis TaxID=216820 RepID=A0A7S1DDY4_CYCTE|mmetsp:Transcript_8169/g.13991  ORF Transcript_8169/g.13991 Transcript_8169/m.13991 type:complete len:121 (+) Transcript_8169:140-502(+)
MKKQHQTPRDDDVDEMDALRAQRSSHFAHDGQPFSQPSQATTRSAFDVQVTAELVENQVEGVVVVPEQGDGDDEERVCTKRSYRMTALVICILVVALVVISVVLVIISTGGSDDWRLPNV